MSYYPEPAPTDIKQLAEYLEREFRRIADALAAANDLEELHAEPERLLTGMVRLADGTDFDPGGGQGVYLYNGSTWVKLG